jgi:hypothetical protein
MSAESWGRLGSVVEHVRPAGRLTEGSFGNTAALEAAGDMAGGEDMNQ